MKLYTILFYPVRNEVLLFCYITTVSGVLKTKYCNFCTFEDWEYKINRMKDILCITVKIKNDLFFISTFFTWYFHVWHMLLSLYICRELLDWWIFWVRFWFMKILCYLLIWFMARSPNLYKLLVQEIWYNYVNNNTNS